MNVIFKAFLGLLLSGFYIVPTAALAQESLNTCEARPVKIHGSSLSPLVANGAHVMMKPASCAGDIHTGDFIIFETGADDMPVIKIVKAVPGDHFSIENGYVFVNDQKQRTSTDKEYYFAPGKDAMLKLYQNSFDGLVPPNMYLVLGENPSGTIDSSRIGLINQKDILMVGDNPEITD